MRVTETDVADWVAPWLSAAGYTILQLVSPGGQATLSITYVSSAGGRKVIFPDILCVHTNHILVGEMKARRSAADHAKLLALAQSRDGATRIRNLAQRISTATTSGLSIQYALVHAQTNVDPDEYLTQIVVTSPATATVLLPKPVVSPGE